MQRVHNKHYSLAKEVLFVLTLLAVLIAAIVFIVLALSRPSHASELLFPSGRKTPSHHLAAERSPDVSHPASPRPTVAPKTPAPKLPPTTARPSLPRADGPSCTATWFTGARGAYGPLTGYFAASRTYPGGSRLLVSHAGRSVVVTVLDYGPASWTGHCLDLAPAAFAQLAPTSAGVIDVTYREVK